MEGLQRKTELRVPSTCRLKLCVLQCAMRSRSADIQLQLHLLGTSWLCDCFPCYLKRCIFPLIQVSILKSTWGRSQSCTLLVPSLSAVSSDVKWGGRPDQSGEADLHCLTWSRLKPRNPVTSSHAQKTSFLSGLIIPSSAGWWYEHKHTHWSRLCNPNHKSFVWRPFWLISLLKGP